MSKPDFESMQKDLSAYAGIMKQEMDILGDEFPDDVREAYGIAIGFMEILADPTIRGLSLREAVFDKLPREKLEWSMAVIKRWRARDERYAAARSRERERRHKNGGKLVERKLTDEKNLELSEKFDTMRILRAVEALDKLRAVFSDRLEGGLPRPPEVRDSLLELHAKAHYVIDEADCDTDKGLFDLAWDLEDELFDAVEALEEISKVLRDLTELCPSEEDEWEDEPGL